MKEKLVMKHLNNMANALKVQKLAIQTQLMNPSILINIIYVLIVAQAKLNHQLGLHI